MLKSGDEQAACSEAGTLQGKGRRRQRITYTPLVTDLAMDCQFLVRRVRVRTAMSLACLVNVKRWSFGYVNADRFWGEQFALDHSTGYLAHSRLSGCSPDWNMRIPTHRQVESNSIRSERIFRVGRLYS